MARLKIHETSVDDYGVPPELRDWDSPFWADPAEFVRWVDANLGGSQAGPRMEDLCRSAGHGPRFDFAVTEWALRNGFRSERSPHSVDRELMDAQACGSCPRWNDVAGPFSSLANACSIPFGACESMMAVSSLHKVTEVTVETQDRRKATHGCAGHRRKARLARGGHPSRGTCASAGRCN